MQSWRQVILASVFKVLAAALSSAAELPAAQRFMEKKTMASSDWFSVDLTNLGQIYKQQTLCNLFFILSVLLLFLFNDFCFHWSLLLFVGATSS